MRTATLYYRRLPDRVDAIETTVLEETGRLVVLHHALKPSKPLEVDGRIVLDDGYDAVWFVYRGKYHDIGVIKDLEGDFTGYYCDVILPIAGRNGSYEVTDLFLDLWITPDGRAFVLDEDEFEEAVSKNWVSQKVARVAEKELERMIRGVAEGKFPPRLVRDYAVGKARGT